MSPDVRRIVAVEAHRRRSGRCPVRVYALGTGETFDIKPTAEGFIDVTTGLSVRTSGNDIIVPTGAVELKLVGDVFFEGVERASGERFSGRAGGGSSVTLYDRDGDDYFQYAVVAEGDAT